MTALVWPRRMQTTEGGLVAKSHIDRVPSRDEQQKWVRSLFANFTIVTAIVC